MTQNSLRSLSNPKWRKRFIEYCQEVVIACVLFNFGDKSDRSVFYAYLDCKIEVKIQLNRLLTGRSGNYHAAKKLGLSISKEEVKRHYGKDRWKTIQRILMKDKSKDQTFIRGNCVEVRKFWLKAQPHAKLPPYTEARLKRMLKAVKKVLVTSCALSYYSIEEQKEADNKFLIAVTGRKYPWEAIARLGVPIDQSILKQTVHEDYWAKYLVYKKKRKAKHERNRKNLHGKKR